MTLLDNDSELDYLHRLRNGDQRAFIYFYDIFKLPIYRKLLKMVRIKHLAEELTQDVFVRIWDKRALIDPEQSFKSYLYRIAQHILYDFYRKVARDERLQDEIRLLVLNEQNPTDDWLFLKETQNILDQAISSLPEQQRQIYTLCKMKGKSYKEVALELGISVHTISTHMTRASKKIQEFMTKYQNLILISGICSTFFK
ncbi:RNA polymerase sigma factor [Sphingobacterium yanglingense]|uniref:RNA polymerase sigma factor n=1 Tax=Sphingobacterium yanglingense TaxID=1437280 RepID=A0A4R6W444_9SPHI|nr:sigma-70 family RNA polymerase sigma factor [Sphingobacterium yanglingense]TDQ72249.1 RNA polymerase ECF family sigma subunit [Sphingobacterium yanglingense]